MNLSTKIKIAILFPIITKAQFINILEDQATCPLNSEELDDYDLLDSKDAFGEVLLF
ncbi:MAG: hypothetical protein AAF849_14915 [Bacteroidota bacterium]